MSKTVALTITVTTVGDGDNHTDTFTFTNFSGVPQTRVPTFNGTTTVNIPPGVRAVVIVVPPGSTVTKTIKGAVGGDTGCVLTPGAAFHVLPLAPTATALNVLANGAEVLSFIWI